MNNHENIVRIKAVQRALEHFKDKIAFVGGATVSLYADSPAVEIRPTDDVDVVMEILSYGNYAQVEEILRANGFKHDVFSKVQCRYILGQLTVDIMPISSNIIGFTNMWYADGFAESIQHIIDDQITVRIFTAPYFIATKLEAYKARGNNDGRTSQDFEDIVFVLEHRKVIWEELKATDGKLKDYLQLEFRILLDVSAFSEWLQCHVEQTASPPANYYILERLEEFTAF